jgi:CRISPR/Cas system CMR-associated protein Cmr1 (group 7 of RAMP superfamily)
LLHSFITPDHSLAELFRIESKWEIVQIEVGHHRFHFQCLIIAHHTILSYGKSYTHTDVFSSLKRRECKVTIHVSVECKKRWFGFQNMMEAALSDKVPLLTSLLRLDSLFPGV